MRRSRPYGLAAALAVLLAATVGCGGDGDDDPEATETSTTEQSQPVIIEIVEDDGEVMDSGRTVKVDVGEEVQLNVSSDAADTIHVHSDPEHEFTIGADDDESFRFTIDSPGTYEVESHELEVVILKLEVS
jgi:hypothetical protein